MATKDELAREYARRIRNSNDMFREADIIVDEIKNLAHLEPNKPIYVNDKDEIIELIRENFVPTLGFLRGTDNRNYLQLVNYMLSQIRKT